MTNAHDIHLPQFRIAGDKVLFLDQYPYISLGSVIDSSNPIHRKILLDEGVILQKKNIERNNFSQEHFLVIEPHPDDFALSCSGLMLDKISQGADMTLLNVFAKSSLKTFPWNDRVKITEEQYQALRIQESQIVADYLNVLFKSYNLPLGLKRGYSSPFGSLKPHDSILIDDLSSKIEEDLKDHTILVGPLAVQNHVDHIAVYKAIFQVKQRNPETPLVFYEDLPYSKNRFAFYDRLKEVSEQMTLETIYVNIEPFTKIMADLASVYRSQFDDVNRIQMLALIQDHARTIAQEARYQGEELQWEFAQRAFKGGELK